MDLPETRDAGNRWLEVGRWWLLACLMVAPWMHGSTPPWARERLGWLLLPLALAVPASLWQRRQAWRGWGLPVGVGTALLALGWGMAANARMAYVPEADNFIPLKKVVGFLPGSVDGPVSFAAMRLVTGIFAAFLVTLGMVNDGGWRRRLWVTTAVTGMSVALLGLVQEATGAKRVFWGEGPAANLFATYVNRNNGAAYVNLVLPLLVGWTVRAFGRGAPVWGRVWAGLGTCIAGASVYVTGSRAGALIGTAVMGGAIGFGVLAMVRTRVRQVWGWQRTAAALVLVFAALAALGWAAGWDETWKRLSSLEAGVPEDARWEAYAAESAAADAAGAFGFGPGTFMFVFPSFCGERLAAMGQWRHAHNDWLQTVIEWGWAGSALWFLLWGGAAVRTMRHLWRHRTAWMGEEAIFGAMCLAALGGVALHAAVDFPLQIPSISLQAAVLVAACWGLEPASRERRTRRGRGSAPALDALPDSHPPAPSQRTLTLLAPLAPPPEESDLPASSAPRPRELPPHALRLRPGTDVPENGRPAGRKPRSG